MWLVFSAPLALRWGCALAFGREEVARFLD